MATSKAPSRNAAACGASSWKAAEVVPAGCGEGAVVWSCPPASAGAGTGAPATGVQSGSVAATSPVCGLDGLVQMAGKVAATSASAHMTLKPLSEHSGMSGIAAVEGARVVGCVGAGSGAGGW